MPERADGIRPVVVDDDEQDVGTQGAGFHASVVHGKARVWQFIAGR